MRDRMDVALKASGHGNERLRFSVSSQQLNPWRRLAMQARISVSTREGRRPANTCVVSTEDKTPGLYPYWDKALPLRPAPPSGPLRPPGGKCLLRLALRP